MLTRRDVLKIGGVAVAAAALPLQTAKAETVAARDVAPFTVPPLEYPVDALEPFIDAKTMEIHHDKHHAAYVTALNKAVESAPELKGVSLERMLSKLDTVPEAVRTAVRNHGGGHANHSLFWQILKKNENGKPVGKLAEAIDAAFGSYDKFKTTLTQKAMGQFGSGWAWLSLSADKKLTVHSAANQDSPLMSGLTPLVGVDVWEHAYYLKYQNKRADYVAAFFNVINWEFVNDRYAKLMA